MKHLEIKFLKDKFFWGLICLGPVFIMFLALYKKNFSIGWYLSQPLSFLQLVFLYPIVEEILFRGLVDDYLSGFSKLKKKNKWISLKNIIVTALFVIMHFYNHPPLWALSVFIPSLIFGYSKERYNSLFVPILLHCSYNFSYFLIYEA